ncbi:hypothetical protein DPMN_147217 [Dreissena polymorpha]|uniref:Uncharacterized protein n=1 Tax=Dreissena polymorpha TaxID=45954 RepID=A0A9D4J2S6_DREPO|nr:hypothetical protein DPMN_147217 [Dreissena polymorpha]
MGSGSWEEMIQGAVGDHSYIKVLTRVEYDTGSSGRSLLSQGASSGATMPV